MHAPQDEIPRLLRELWAAARSPQCVFMYVSNGFLVYTGVCKQAPPEKDPGGETGFQMYLHRFKTNKKKRTYNTII